MDPWTGELNHSLAVEALERENARIVRLRERDAQRNALFQETRRRSVDYKTLAVQCTDNELRRKEEAELDRRYAEMMKATTLLGEVARHEEEEERQKAMKDLAADWAVQSALPKNTMQRMGARVVPEQCGLAACQSLQGEDKDGTRRKQRQQQQLQSWVTQQKAIYAQRARDEKEEDMRFAKWDAHVAAQRSKLDAVDAERKAIARRALRDEHLAAADADAARQRAEKQAVEDADRAEIARNLAHPLYNEDQQILDADGRPRLDHYRGLTKPQIKRLYYENYVIDRDLKDRKQREAREEREQDLHNLKVQRAREAVEYEKAIAKKSDYAALAADLQATRRVEHDRKQQAKADAFGAIGEGLFSSFGNSYR